MRGISRISRMSPPSVTPADPRPAGPALSAAGLEKHFARKHAVKNATFSVPRDCVFGFLGPNGAGKTTVLRLVLGLLRPDAGEICVLGLDPVRQPREVRLRTGYVSQLHSLYGDLTVDENLRFFGQLYGLAGGRLNERVAEQKERFRLEEHRGPAAALGTGVQRRTALACALLHRPELLILDEPTSGMDSLGRREFWTFLGGLTADGTTIVITTHHLEEAEGCDDLALMLDGEVRFQGSPAELKARYAGPVLAVSCDPWEVGFAALREAYGASLFGTSSHIDGLAATPADVEALLARKGVRLVGLEERPPTMEDAFLRATMDRQPAGV
jgi:ABC-2 type transport system ATP-binding protein